MPEANSKTATTSAPCEVGRTYIDTASGDVYTCVQSTAWNPLPKVAWRDQPATKGDIGVAATLILFAVFMNFVWTFRRDDKEGTK